MVQVHNDFFPDWPNMAAKADMGVKKYSNPFWNVNFIFLIIAIYPRQVVLLRQSAVIVQISRAVVAIKRVVYSGCHLPHFYRVVKNGTINWTFWIFPVSSTLRGGLLWLISVNIIGVYYWSIESSNLISQWLHSTVNYSSQTPIIRHRHQLFVTDTTSKQPCLWILKAEIWTVIFSL